VRYSGDRRSNCFDLTHFKDLNIFLDSDNCLGLVFRLPSSLLIKFTLVLSRLTTFGEEKEEMEEGKDELEMISDEMPSFKGVIYEIEES
jgi:hypothetical protein